MFGLIRRISNSVLPRLDRPWDDDATSNAPKVGRKRRLSSTERDLGEDNKDEQSRSKKHRGNTPQTPLELPAETSSSLDETASTSQLDSEGVKEVTKGVEEVELEDGKTSDHSDEAEVPAADDSSNEETVVAPELVPLPEEVSGELDDSSSIASTPAAETVDEQTTDVQQTAGSLEHEVVDSKQRSALDNDTDDEATSVPAEQLTKSSASEELKDGTSA